MVFMPSIPLLNSALDLTTVTFISSLIILSVLSLCFIFHLRFKSQSITHLQGFNSLWTVRFLLVLFIILWAITEFLRLPFFRRRYLYPFLPSLVIATPDQATLCKVHVVLSLGFFEPAFLVTLLFLLNASIKNKTPNDVVAVTFVLLTCLPIATIQGFISFFQPLVQRLPVLFRESSVAVTDGFGNDTVLCSYPLLNSIVFAGFGFAYSAWFLFSCWRVLSLVINNGLRVRIYALAAVVMVALPLQVAALGLSTLWSPDHEIYGVVSLVVFLGAFCSAATGEGIMVIKPISDALEAGGACCRLTPRDGDGGKKGSPVPERVAVGDECV